MKFYIRRASDYGRDRPCSWAKEEDFYNDDGSLEEEKSYFIEIDTLEELCALRERWDKERPENNQDHDKGLILQMNEPTYRPGNYPLIIIYDSYIE